MDSITIKVEGRRIIIEGFEDVDDAECMAHWISESLVMVLNAGPKLDIMTETAGEA